MPLKQHLFFIFSGLAAIILNIEEQAKNPDVIRLQTYPLLIFIEFFIVMTGVQLSKLKDLVVKLLAIKRPLMFETQIKTLGLMP